MVVRVGAVGVAAVPADLDILSREQAARERLEPLLGDGERRAVGYRIYADVELRALAGLALGLHAVARRGEHDGVVAALYIGLEVADDDVARLGPIALGLHGLLQRGAQLPVIRLDLELGRDHARLVVRAAAHFKPDHSRRSLPLCRAISPRPSACCRRCGGARRFDLSSLYPPRSTRAAPRRRGRPC